MSDVKIVFSNIVGGSGVANQIRSLAEQLMTSNQLNVGDMTVVVDSFFASEHLTDQTFKPKYVVKGRVVEKPASKPQWTNADTTPPTEEGYYWVILVPGGKPVLTEYWPHWKQCGPCWLQPHDEYGSKFEGTHYIKINEPESL